MNNESQSRRASTASRVRDYVRSNVLGLVAIYIALTGTALALPGTDTVFSDDITDGQVKTADIAKYGVSSGRLADDAVLSRTVYPGAIRSEAIANDSIASVDIGFGAVDSYNLADVITLRELEFLPLNHSSHSCDAATEGFMYYDYQERMLAVCDGLSFIRVDTGDPVS